MRREKKRYMPNSYTLKGKCNKIFEPFLKEKPSTTTYDYRLKALTNYSIKFLAESTNKQMFKQILKLI